MCRVGSSGACDWVRSACLLLMICGSSRSSKLHSTCPVSSESISVVSAFCYRVSCCSVVLLRYFLVASWWLRSLTSITVFSADTDWISSCISLWLVAAWLQACVDTGLSPWRMATNAKPVFFVDNLLVVLLSPIVYFARLCSSWSKSFGTLVFIVDSSRFDQLNPGLVSYFVLAKMCSAESWPVKQVSWSKLNVMIQGVKYHVAPHDAIIDKPLILAWMGKIMGLAAVVLPVVPQVEEFRVLSCHGEAPEIARLLACVKGDLNVMRVSIYWMNRDESKFDTRHRCTLDVLHVWQKTSENLIYCSCLICCVQRGREWKKN